MASVSRLITSDVKKLGLPKEQFLKGGKEAIANANLSGMNGRKFANKIQPGKVKLMQADLI